MGRNIVQFQDSWWTTFCFDQLGEKKEGKLERERKKKLAVVITDHGDDEDDVSGQWDVIT